jgi:TRAP-type C4-dicarboxylate transport system substrate-binding protein
MRAAFLAAVVALALAGAACADSGPDKAGGRSDAATKTVGKPVSLTLVTVDQQWAMELADAAKRLSGGTIRIDVRLNGDALVDYEPRLVEAVRAGRADMASVGARAWDRMGVTSFRGLVAPFLVDSLELERSVLESPAAAALLEGVRPLGLVGVALLPGPLRRPLGISRPLVGPREYRGAKVGLRFGRVAQDTLKTLGATPTGYRTGSLAGLDGAELDVATLARNRYDAPGSKLTANVVLWPRPETIVISRRAFARLDPSQQRILLRAGQEAIGPVFDRLRDEQSDAVDAVCNRGAVSFVDASTAQVAGLQAATRPVYAALERDPGTRGLITSIRRLRGRQEEADALRCGGAMAAPSALEGRWESDVSRKALLANGASEAEVSTYGGRGTLQLDHGRWTFRGDHTTVDGTYTVAGDTIRLTMLTCTANPCAPGSRTDYTWNVYRDTLSFRARAGAPVWPLLVAEPRRRVG